MDDVTRAISLSLNKQNKRANVLVNPVPHISKKKPRTGQLTLTSLFPKSIEEEEESILIAMSRSLADEDPNLKYKDQRICNILMPEQAQKLGSRRLLEFLDQITLTRKGV